MFQTAALIRTKMKKFYAEYDEFLRPVLRFLLAFAVMTIYKLYLPVEGSYSGYAVIAVLSLICAFLPVGTVSAVSAIFIILGIYKESLSITLVLCVYLMVVAALFLGLRPGKTIILSLVPICFILKIPYAVPLILALSAGLSGMIPMLSGVGAWYILDYYHNNAATLQYGTDPMVIVHEFVDITNAIVDSRSIFIVSAAFVAGMIVTLLISKISIDHCRTIAIVIGALITDIVYVAGHSFFAVPFDTASLLIGSLIGTGIALLYNAFVFNVDFRGKEFLTIEDDDYIYYVKAIPKIRESGKEERK